MTKEERKKINARTFLCPARDKRLTPTECNHIRGRNGSELCKICASIGAYVSLQATVKVGAPRLGRRNKPLNVAHALCANATINPLRPQACVMGVTRLSTQRGL